LSQPTHGRCSIQLLWDILKVNTTTNPLWLGICHEQFCTCIITFLGTPEVQKYEAFYVFHKNGYTAYQPENCETIRHVKGDFGNLKYIPEELDRAPSMLMGN
jgi:hypothetical protein